MGAEFFAFIFFWPVLLFVAGLVLARLFAPRPWLSKESFGISRRAIIMGLLGALLGLLIYCAQDSYFLAVERVAENEGLRETGALRLALGWTIFAFFLYSGFTLLLFAVFCVPVLSALFRLRLISVSGFLLVAGIIVSLLATFVFVSPYNSWCDRNPISCAQHELMSGLSFWLPMMCGFALGARLPLLISKYP